jgi:hypothetical protein
MGGFSSPSEDISSEILMGMIATYYYSHGFEAVMG